MVPGAYGSCQCFLTVTASECLVMSDATLPDRTNLTVDTQKMLFKCSISEISGEITNSKLLVLLCHLSLLKTPSLLLRMVLLKHWSYYLKMRRMVDMGVD